MRARKIVIWLALLVFAALCIVLAGLQLRTTVRGRALDKTMTSHAIEPSAILTLMLTNTSTATPIIVSTIEPSSTQTIVPTETEAETATPSATSSPVSNVTPTSKWRSMNTP